MFGMHLKIIIISFFIKSLYTNLVPNKDGILTTVSADHLRDLQIKARSIKHCLVTFTLYTRKNSKNGHIIYPHQESSLKNSPFNPDHPTRIIIHGWRQNGQSKMNDLIGKAYLDRGNFNIIVVDWSSVAKRYYVVARLKTQQIGTKVARFIDFLHKTANMKFETLYLIGFSLGAHVAGFAGKYVKNGRIDTIFGLDPAAPLYLTSTSNNRLSSTDAEYVETIHTNGRVLGLYEKVGQASFFPNWGKSQPGCSKNACSHSRSYKYFAESIGENNRFLAVKCKNFDSILLQRCFENKGMKRFKMGGEPSNKENANGVYFLRTNSKEPFGMG